MEDEELSTEVVVFSTEGDAEGSASTTFETSGVGVSSIIGAGVLIIGARVGTGAEAV